MTFALIDLVKAKHKVDNAETLLTNFDFNQPYHAIIHLKTNRIVSLTKYRETVYKLIDLEDLQPVVFLNNSGWEGYNFNDILQSNTDMTYNIKLNSNNINFRCVSEFKFIVFSAERTDLDNVWNDTESLAKEKVVEIRLKAAMLDKVYECLNWQRCLKQKEIALDFHIYNLRYNQAIEYVKDNSIENKHFLKIYADHQNMDYMSAAKHCIFCFEEDMNYIATNEKLRLTFEQKILNAQSFEELTNIDFDWFRITWEQI
jgi:predicted XRE-type DNA-binding protein